MQNLTNEILENISDYEMEKYISEENLIRAHMDAIMKEYIIYTECEHAGIVMESGDEDDELTIIPKRNGENIFKYIFLFIPRLIINIFKKIKAWWERLRNNALEAEKKKYEDAEYAKVVELGEGVAAKVNELCGTNRFIFQDNKFMYLSTLKNPNPASVISYYEKIKNMYVLYKEELETFKGYLGKNSYDSNLVNNYKNMIVDHGEDILQISEIIGDEPIYPIIEEHFAEGVQTILDVVKKCSDEVTTAMENVQKDYAEIEPYLNSLNHEFAKRYIDFATDLDKVFGKFNAVVVKDYDGAVEAFLKKDACIKILIEDEHNQNVKKYGEKQAGLEDKKSKEKFDKWGLK